MPINIAKGTEDCQAMSNGLLNLGLEVRVLCQDPAKKKTSTNLQSPGLVSSCSAVRLLPYQFKSPCMSQRKKNIFCFHTPLCPYILTGYKVSYAAMLAKNLLIALRS